MIEKISGQNDATTVEYCRRMLYAVSLAYRPLRLEELGITAGLPRERFHDLQSLCDLISRCGSFLSVREDSVFFVHLSAKDYFTSGNGKFFVDTVTDEESRITPRLLDAMKSILKRDICNLQNPGVRIQETYNSIKQSNLPQIAYACEYWVAHLKTDAESFDDMLMDGGVIGVFLQKHLLHWLEAMSLLQKIPEALMAIQELQLILNVRE